MMQYADVRETGWSRGGAAMAAFAVAEIAMAWAMAAQSVRPGVLSMAIATALAIASVLLIARCRMPAVVKLALLGAGCGSLLIWSATQDPLRLRAVAGTTDDALTAAAIQGATPARVHAAPPIGATAEEVAATAALGDALEHELAHSDVGVATSIILAGNGSDRAYTVKWALERTHERLWCGNFSEAAGRDADFAMLVDRIGDAARQSSGGPLKCG